jgi:hypothetical protein
MSRVLGARAALFIESLPFFISSREKNKEIAYVLQETATGSWAGESARDHP